MKPQSEEKQREQKMNKDLGAIHKIITEKHGDRGFLFPLILALCAALP